jgi:hypothetical protein
MVDTAAIDAATLRLYERVAGAPHNRVLIGAMEAAPDCGWPSGFSTGVCIVLVPGLFYKEFPHTGADGAVMKDVARSMGIPVLTIPVDESDGIESAADLIIADLLAAPSSATSIILVSLSIGSAEIRHALTKPGASRAFRRVGAWISVSGLPLGTPSLESVLRNPVRRILIKAQSAVKGWKFDVVRDLLRHRPGAPFLLPPHLMFIQVVAFPLHRHLRERRCRRLRTQLAPFGPNDGFTLLEELAALPGHLYPVWGADHYLRGIDDLPARIGRLISFVLPRAQASVKGIDLRAGFRRKSDMPG